ncbi:TIGR04211 family SH3 domain-containing protein [Planctobacterium marinum]|uniref:TIGR04211 family SH3 domain-containing protein n=1 Tax=Planctobacterium marinum TaxID=1631968 RepID=UPI001E43FCD6|nr:TIGR04211 family SH3 domain-containing protein [Planctobacterium marinum]MCC2605277.1 TIGR04211 family SH3 domain-containing protein [Planctobacterium marinum]
MIKRLFFLLFLINSQALIAQENDDLSSVDNTESDANYAFVSDDLFIYMHSGPGTNYRILGSVTAGSAISILNTDTEAGFTEISDERDRTGWIKSEFVSDTSIRQQIQQLEVQLEDTGPQLQTQSDEILRLESQLRAAEQEKVELSQQLEEQMQLASQLEQQLSTQTTDAEKEMFYRGAMVAGSGALAGIFLTLVLRRKKRSDSLYDRY